MRHRDVDEHHILYGGWAGILGGGPWQFRGEGPRGRPWEKVSTEAFGCAFAEVALGRLWGIFFGMLGGGLGCRFRGNSLGDTLGQTFGGGFGQVLGSNLREAIGGTFGRGFGGGSGGGLAGNLGGNPRERHGDSDEGQVDFDGVDVG